MLNSWPRFTAKNCGFIDERRLGCSLQKRKIEALFDSDYFRKNILIKATQKKQLAAIYCYWRVEAELRNEAFQHLLARWQGAEIRGYLLDILGYVFVCVYTRTHTCAYTHMLTHMYIQDKRRELRFGATF